MDQETLSADPVVVRNGGVLGGRPIFRGTRVQVEILFENLAAGHNLDDIVENFPTLDRAELRMALNQACAALKEAAPDITPERDPEAAHARLTR